MKSPPRILLHNDRTDELECVLRRDHPEVAIACCNSYKDLPDTVTDFRPDIVYTVRFAGTKGFPKDSLLASGGPCWIANGGAGTDHFGHWNPEKVTITNAAGVAAGMMAEYVMGAFLHFSLDVPGLQSDKALRHWRARMVRPLQGKTLLVIGLGNTGREIAARAKAFGMTVIGTRTSPKPMPNVDEVGGVRDLHAFLSRADYIAVATPLTNLTRNLLNTESFKSVRKGAVLADVSRGGVICPTALQTAIESGTITAAALDVFETEPLPPSSPFWTFDNVLISPHCSSVYEGWEMASFNNFLDNLGRWKRGDTLRNVVDPIRGY